MNPYFQDKGVTLYQADCCDALKALLDCSVDSIVCDPPYELGFMGKGWDRSGIAYDVSVWRECLRVLKPGGHLLAFGGSRTYHRLACAIEDAGFEIRDQIQWLYGSGFPKSLDVSKAIDAAAGAEREVIGPSARHGGGQNNGFDKGSGETLGNAAVPFLTRPASDAAKQWQGFGTALKPAHEPIVLARKPLIGTVAENVLKHGTGGLNIAACRISGIDPANEKRLGRDYTSQTTVFSDKVTQVKAAIVGGSADGRWPANVILSYPEDEYVLRSNVTPEQKKELFKWLYENA